MKRSEKITLWWLKHYIKFRVCCFVLPLSVLSAIYITGIVKKWGLGFTIGLGLTTTVIIILGLTFLFKTFSTLLLNIKDAEDVEVKKEAFRLMTNLVDRRNW